MDVSAIASLATEMSQTQNAQAIQIAVLKKAMEVQAQGALQLVLSATQSGGSNPPYMGGNVDVFA